MVHFRLHFSTSQLYHYQKSLTRKQQKCGVTHDSSMHDKETAKMLIQVYVFTATMSLLPKSRMWGELEMSIIVDGYPGCRQAEKIVVEVFILLS